MINQMPISYELAGIALQALQVLRLRQFAINRVTLRQRQQRKSVLNRFGPGLALHGRHSGRNKTEYKHRCFYRVKICS